MRIDEQTFRKIANAILLSRSTLSREEAFAITQLAYLASGADLHDDEDEGTLRAQLGRQVCALAGVPFESVPWPSPLPVPEDDEGRVQWLRALGRELQGPGARELAYVIAYLVTIGDLALQPVESVFLDELQAVLGIADERAEALVGHASEQVTPMAEPVSGEPA